MKLPKEFRPYALTAGALINIAVSAQRAIGRETKYYLLAGDKPVQISNLGQSVVFTDGLSIEVTLDDDGAFATCLASDGSYGVRIHLPTARREILDGAEFRTMTDAEEDAFDAQTKVFKHKFKPIEIPVAVRERHLAELARLDQEAGLI